MQLLLISFIILFFNLDVLQEFLCPKGQSSALELDANLIFKINIFALKVAIPTNKEMKYLFSS